MHFHKIEKMLTVSIKECVCREGAGLMEIRGPPLALHVAVFRAALSLST